LGRFHDTIINSSQLVASTRAITRICFKTACVACFCTLSFERTLTRLVIFANSTRRSVTFSLLSLDLTSKWVSRSTIILLDSKILATMARTPQPRLEPHRHQELLQALTREHPQMLQTVVSPVETPRLPYGTQFFVRICWLARMGELEPWIDDQFVKTLWYNMGEQVNVKMIRDKFSGYGSIAIEICWPK
jgi:hypothetical protein